MSWLRVTRRHVAPASSERYSEGSVSSISVYTRLGSDGATATAILPTAWLASGSPCPASRFHVAPPSRVTHRPLPGPPLFRFQVLISSCHIPANSTLGSPGSIARSAQPVFASTNSTRVQVLPPSVVRYTPRSGAGPNARPSAHAYTTSGLVGWITMRPTRPVESSPMWLQLRPASVDL